MCAHCRKLHAANWSLITGPGLPLLQRDACAHAAPKAGQQSHTGAGTSTSHPQNPSTQPPVRYSHTTPRPSMRYGHTGPTPTPHQHLCSPLNEARIRHVQSAEQQLSPACHRPQLLPQATATATGRSHCHRHCHRPQAAGHCCQCPQASHAALKACSTDRQWGQHCTPRLLSSHTLPTGCSVVCQSHPQQPPRPVNACLSQRLQAFCHCVTPTLCHHLIFTPTANQPASQPGIVPELSCSAQSRQFSLPKRV